MFIFSCAGAPPIVAQNTAAVYKETSRSIIHDEHIRTRAGFNESSSVGQSLSGTQPPRLKIPTSFKFPPIPPQSTTACPSGSQQPATQQFRIPQAPISQRHPFQNTPQQSQPAPTIQGQGPPPAPASNITQQQAPSGQPAPGGDQNPMAQFMQMMQYMATHFPPPATSTAKDPESKMAQALEQLRLNPTQVPAGLDDRCEVLHEARFYGGAVGLLQDKWLRARELHGLEGVTPLASYDFDAVGIAGCITSKGLYDMHNPANPNLKLKHFSSTNVGSSSLSSKRLTLAEGDHAVDINESFRELEHMADFKAALRVAMKAMTIVLPFNHSVSAIESFMENSVYCAEKTAHLSDKERAQELTAFVDHVFHTNSRRWVAKQGFLTATELAPVFQSWIGSRPAGRLAAVAASTPATAAVSEDSKPGGSHYNYNYNRRGGKNKNHGGWNNNSGFSQNFNCYYNFNCYLPTW